MHDSTVRGMNSPPAETALCVSLSHRWTTLAASEETPVVVRGAVSVQDHAPRGQLRDHASFQEDPLTVYAHEVRVRVDDVDVHLRQLPRCMPLPADLHCEVALVHSLEAAVPTAPRVGSAPMLLDVKANDLTSFRAKGQHKLLRLL
jgi:hypothetical protein